MRLWPKGQAREKPLTFDELVAKETAEAEAALDPLELSKRTALKMGGVNWWPPGKEPAFIKRAWQDNRSASADG